jgi:diguanylate cyclase (GGDEF)-like protein
MHEVSDLTEFIRFSIEKSIILLKGYEVYLSTDPNITEEITLKYLENLIGDNEMIKNVSIIKDTTIIFSYPKEGNVGAIGTDLSMIPGQKDTLLKVKDTLEPTFFGPIDLVQGGRGYIARTPVITDGNYWGQVSIVLKEDEVNRLILEEAADAGLEVAMFQGQAKAENLVLGDATILDKNPIFSEINMLGTSYAVSGVKDETASAYQSFTLFYLVSFFFSLMLGYLFFTSVRKSGQIAVQAAQDKLTRVHNRTHLDYFLKGVFQRAKNNQTFIGILVMDIDDFKKTNDVYGHLAGDQVLLTAASSMLASCRKTETIFRMGGDEFMIVFQDIDGRESFELIVDRILNQLPDKIPYQKHEIPFSVSVGYALYPEDGESFDTLFKYADDRMYEQKRKRSV